MGRNVDSLNWTKFPQDETSPIGTKWVKLGEVLKAVAYDQQAAIREATDEAVRLLAKSCDCKSPVCYRCQALASLRKARGE